jgi:hypothetical protein
MKLNELILDFEIQTTNEERELLDKIASPRLMESFNERDQFILQSLIRKSLISKIHLKNQTWVIPNEKH